MTKESPDPGSSSGEPEIFPVLPLRDICVFPHMIVPLFVGRDRSIKALEEAMRTDKQLLLVAQKSSADDEPSPDALHSFGTMATVLQFLKLPNETVKVLVEGTTRARVLSYMENEPYLEARVADAEEEPGAEEEIEALARSAVIQFENYIKVSKRVSSEILGNITQIEDYSKLADTIASHLAIKVSDKQKVLEITTLSERMAHICALMESEIAILRTEKKIRNRIKNEVDATGRDTYLSDQLKALQRELDDPEDNQDDIGEFEERIVKTKLSKEAAEMAFGELKKLRRMGAMSPESMVSRNISTGSYRYRGVSSARSTKISVKPNGSSTRSILASKRSRNVSSSISQCRRAPINSRGRSYALSALPVSAKLPSVGRSPERRAAISCVCPSAACATRPKSVAIDGPMWARCRARLYSPCARLKK